jgi:hypothetical protein
MKRGFQLFKTRNTQDSINIELLEDKFKIKIPPLYKLFIKTFHVGNIPLETDKLIINKQVFDGNCVITEFERNNIMFVDFISIEQSLSIRKEMFDEDDAINIEGYIPIIRTASNAIIHIGSKGLEADKLILDSDHPERFKILGVNIFEFVQTLVLEEIKYNSFNHSNLYKNWEEDFWRLRE